MSTNRPMPAMIARHYAEPPQQTAADGSRTWLARGANFVVAWTEAEAGAVLERSDQPDEYIVLTPHVAAAIEAGGERIEAAPDSLTIVPPGKSRVILHDKGAVVRIFSSEAKDLLAASSNAAAYAEGAPGVAPLAPWPEPVGGYRLRSYRLAEHVKPGSNLRVFRTRNLMVNMLVKREVPRDPAKLSPHSHVDFEQGSLAVSGTYIHHCRYPWTPDMGQWREDEHVQVESPSLLVVPPKVIHTSQNIGSEVGWLVDIFAPPRVDFSLRPGVVCNADEYPMPQLSAEALAAAAAAKE